MQVKILDQEALKAVSPASLVAYARAAGWRKAEEYGKFSDVYVATDFPELIIPRTRRLGDYAYIVSQVLDVFASATDADEISLYRDLVAADRDIIRLCVSAEDNDGSITVRRGLEMMRGANNMLTAAARSVVDTQAVYHGRISRRVQDYLNEIRLGQTEQSSYVVTLMSPVVAPKMQRELGLDESTDDEPIERRTTVRLVEALQETRCAVERAVGGDATAFSKSVRHGVSANLCEAVAELAEPFPELDVIVTWARTRPVDGIQSIVRFSKADAPILREAARVFRSEAPQPDMCITGPVERLTREESELDGTITIRAYVESKVRSIKAVFRYADYGRAVRAHGEKASIVLHGDLERVGQRWRLLNPRVVEVISTVDVTKE